MSFLIRVLKPKEVSEILGISYNKVKYLRQIWLAKQRGFENYWAYEKWLVKRRGFKNYWEYKKWLAKQRGFENYWDYLNDWARKRGFENYWGYRKYRRIMGLLKELDIEEDIIKKVENEYKRVFNRAPCLGCIAAIIYKLCGNKEVISKLGVSLEEVKQWYSLLYSNSIINEVVEILKKHECYGLTFSQIKKRAKINERVLRRALKILLKKGIIIYDREWGRRYKLKTPN